jgi:hypothetical protein
MHARTRTHSHIRFVIRVKAFLPLTLVILKVCFACVCLHHSYLLSPSLFSPSLFSPSLSPFLSPSLPRVLRHWQKKEVLFKPPNWQTAKARIGHCRKDRVRNHNLGHQSGARCQLRYSTYSCGCHWQRRSIAATPSTAASLPSASLLKSGDQLKARAITVRCCLDCTRRPPQRRGPAQRSGSLTIRC